MDDDKDENNMVVASWMRAVLCHTELLSSSFIFCPDVSVGLQANKNKNKNYMRVSTMQVSVL